MKVKEFLDISVGQVDLYYKGQYVQEYYNGINSVPEWLLESELVSVSSGVYGNEPYLEIDSR